MRSDKSSTGFKGVRLHKGRYQATCNTAPCHNHHLGTFGTPEEAAQAYLQHWETEHPEELEKERQQPHSSAASSAGAPSHAVGQGLDWIQGCASTQGRYQATCNTAPCRNHHLGTFGTPEEAAQAYLQHWETNHPEELEKERQQGPPAC